VVEGGLLRLLPIVFHNLPPLRLSAVNAYNYVTGRRRGYLPALVPLNAAAGEMTRTLVGALRALIETRAERGAGDDTRGVPQEPKTNQEAYRETYHPLLRFGNNVAQPEAVAPIWNHLADANKSEHHTIIAQEFQSVYMAQGLLTDLSQQR
jgi:hypothetical protein